jgi:hypothetical protein
LAQRHLGRQHVLEDLRVAGREVEALSLGQAHQVAELALLQVLASEDPHAGARVVGQHTFVGQRDQEPAAHVVQDLVHLARALLHHLLQHLLLGRELEVLEPELVEEGVERLGDPLVRLVALVQREALLQLLGLAQGVEEGGESSERRRVHGVSYLACRSTSSAL